MTRGISLADVASRVPASPLVLVEKRGDDPDTDGLLCPDDDAG